MRTPLAVLAGGDARIPIVRAVLRAVAHQALRELDDDAPLDQVHLRHQDRDERDKEFPPVEAPDGEEVLAGQVQDLGNGAEHGAVEVDNRQANELMVVVLVRPGRRCSAATSTSKTAPPRDSAAARSSTPAKVTSRRPACHRVARTVSGPRCSGSVRRIAAGAKEVGIIGADIDRHLAADAVGATDPANDHRHGVDGRFVLRPPGVSAPRPRR